MKLPLTSFGNVCTFVRGPFGGSLKKSSFKESGYAIYEQQHAINNQFENIRYFIDDKKFQEMKRFELFSGDLIMSCSGTMGKVAIVPDNIEKGIINQALLKLSPSNELNVKYLKYWMESESFQESISLHSKGAAIKNVASVKILKQIEIPFPKNNIQKQIVEILDKTFESIDQAKVNIEKNIENTKELFQSRLNEIFSQKGDGWEERTLDEVCEKIFAGGDVPKDNLSEIKTDKYNIPIFANGIKDKGLYGYTDIQKVIIPSITVSARGTIGYSEIRTEPFFPIVRLLVLFPDIKVIDLEFLHYIIKGIDFKNTGTSIPQLTVPMIKSYIVSFPISIIKQREIVKKFDKLSEQTKQLEKHYQRKLKNLEELKKSILQKAFRGELLK
jgi:type I restriction enzyme, S subunit